MERDFKQWLALFRTSIANYQYYTYFDKVFSNVDAIKVELNIMNSDSPQTHLIFLVY